MKKLKSSYHGKKHFGYAAILLLFTSFFPQRQGITQVKESKLIISQVKVSPYDKAADILQDSISEKRLNRDQDFQEIVAALNKKLAERKVKYIIGRRKVIVHDTVFVQSPVALNGTAEDYIPPVKEVPVIIHDTIPCPATKKINFFKRIFKHKN